MNMSKFSRLAAEKDVDLCAQHAAEQKYLQVLCDPILTPNNHFEKFLVSSYKEFQEIVRQEEARLEAAIVSM